MSETISPVYNQSFRGVNIVRVSKSAFNNPGNARLCTEQMNQVLAGSGKRSLKDIIKKLLFHKNDKNKVTAINLSTTPIIGAEQKEGMHTFAVLSGAERDTVLEMFNSATAYEAAGKGQQLSAGSSKLELLNKIKDYFANKRINREINVNTLDELTAYRYLTI